MAIDLEAIKARADCADIDDLAAEVERLRKAFQERTGVSRLSKIVDAAAAVAAEWHVGREMTDREQKLWEALNGD